jgi:sporulation protein YlmC with PRC-barrel domain
VKYTATVLTASFLSLAVALGASAQTRPSTETTPRKDSARSEAKRQAWMPEANAVESNKLVGMKVKTEAGKDIGEIDKLIVDHASGKITHVVLGKGGVLGVGEQKLVLAWSDVKVQRDGAGNRMVAVVEQAKLDSAPRYEARRDSAPAASPASSPSSSEPPKQDKKY